MDDTSNCIIRVAQQFQKAVDTQVQGSQDELHVCFFVDRLQEFGIPGADLFPPVFHILLSLVVLVVFAPLDDFLHSRSVHLPQPNHDVSPFPRPLNSFKSRRNGGTLLCDSALTVNWERFPVAAPEPDDRHDGCCLRRAIENLTGNRIAKISQIRSQRETNTNVFSNCESVITRKFIKHNKKLIL